MRFVDTNVLLYAISSRPSESAKALRANEILRQPDLALSVQVLQEFYVQATRATSPIRIDHDKAVGFLQTLNRYPIQDLTSEIVHSAMVARQRWQISYWDAAIVEAARRMGCKTLLTEDLQHDQDFDGLRVLNPFR